MSSTRKKLQPMNPLNEVSKVCVIGIGAAGLCALRHFNTRTDRFEVTAYEQTDGIGGTWNYTEHVGLDSNGLPIHSSMYKNLHTNLPMEIMEYPDFKSNSTQSYVHHSEVLKYLHKYADAFNLFPYINFNHCITYINRENNQWMVTVKDMKCHREFTKNFDIILICTGRYSVPFWPKFDTLKRFQGSVIHSHDYRVPEIYRGQRVAVIGGGLSGVDISIECSQYSKEVIFINHGKNQFQRMPQNVRQINVEVEEFGTDTIFVRNRQKELISYKIDSIIMATGYIYNLKFLDPKNGIKMNSDGTIDGLYRHMINIEHPSMALFAVTNRVLPLPLYHQQLLYYVKILLGEYILPSKGEMIRDMEEDYRNRLARGMRPKDRHMLEVDMMEEYLDKIAKESQIKPLRKVIIKLHRDLYTVRNADITGYKRFNYKLISDEEYVAVNKHTNRVVYTSQEGFKATHQIGTNSNHQDLNAQRSNGYELI